MQNSTNTINEFSYNFNIFHMSCADLPKILYHPVDEVKIELPWFTFFPKLFIKMEENHQE